jgi:biopolymer transport protein ExbB
MTALGLVVAVPAVLAYNWLQRRNKSIMEDLGAFTNDLHGYLMSDGKVKPSFVNAAPAAGAKAAPAAATRTAGGNAPAPAGSTTGTNTVR